MLFYDSLVIRSCDRGLSPVTLKERPGIQMKQIDSKELGGFADYMRTSEFAVAMKTLIQTERQKRTVIMCAEVLPWRCHRSLIADTLTVAGCPVEHIMSATKTQPHSLTSFAKVEGRRITYPLVD